MLKPATYFLRKLWRGLVGRRRVDPALVTPPTAASAEFQERLQRNIAGCTWEPHPDYSVFTQFDQRFYTALRSEYLRKYRCFWAVSKTIGPRKLIELGTHAGSGADAYLSGSPQADYLGLDRFPDSLRHELTGARWDPFAVAQALLSSRGFTFRLARADLRALKSLPEKADMVVVDAAHDVDNEYADLQLALTADPSWIFVDDANDRRNAGAAIARFLAQDLKGRVEFTVPVDYIEGGLVIRLKAPAA